ncbi:MAG: radical SAM protein [Planctomycetota bacterium]
MRILLIKPRWAAKAGHYRFLRGVRFTPLSLGILAALSEGHDVRIVDRDWQPLPRSGRFDLVGITATTFTSERAFRLADRARQQGARVVLGGVHPSILPDECLRHADSVVIGEAEYVWPEVLKDAERGNMQEIYRAGRPTEMDDVPMPARHLLDESSWFSCVQATRGCPNQCEYCYLPSVPWSTFRKRSVDLVEKEVKQVEDKLVFFVDDNLFADREYVMELCSMMKNLDVNWSVQAPTTIGRDEELLDTMAESGCWHLQVGFQSFNRASLKRAGVYHNRIEDYKRLVDRLRQRGILVTGFFMFGFDTDRPGCFDSTVEQIKHIGVDDAKLYILTPYPGTALYERLKQEGRLLSGQARTQFGWSDAVFQPQHMCPEELEQGVQRAYDRLYLHFLRRMPWAVLTGWRMGLRHPRAIIGMLRGALRRPQITG